MLRSSCNTRSNFTGLASGLQDKAALVTTGTLPLIYAGAMLVDAVAALIFGLMFDKRDARALNLSTLISAPFAILVFMARSLPVLLLGALYEVSIPAMVVVSVCSQLAAIPLYAASAKCRKKEHFILDPDDTELLDRLLPLLIELTPVPFRRKRTTKK